MDSRIGVMGGTFDPVHVGHLIAAGEVIDLLGLDEVVFVPTGKPWQKADRYVTDAEDRYAMTVLATASHPRFRVSRVDIDRPGVTYTADTLRDLRVQYGTAASLFFITGFDTLAKVGSWKSVDEVFELATFVTVNRPGHTLDELELPAHAVVEVVDVPGVDVSSTDCRERVARGRSIRYLLPDPVVRYIESRGLYRDPTPRDVTGG